MTKREKFEAIAGILNDIEGAEELVDFVTHEVEMLDKRAEAPRKETPAQLENAALKANIVELLDTDEEAMTATEIANAVGKSVQKVSQLLRQLVTDGVVTRIEGKGKVKTTFTVV